MQTVRLFSVVLLLASITLGCEEKNSEAQAGVEEKTQPEEQLEVAPAAEPAQAPGPPPWAGRRVAESGFPCAVEDVLASSCRRCHWDPRENDAPFSLVKWEDTQKIRTGKPIHVLMQQMVAAELMPPLDLSVDPAVDPLSPQHKQTILAWLKDGAKKSEEVCE